MWLIFIVASVSIPQICPPLQPCTSYTCGLCYIIWNDNLCDLPHAVSWCLPFLFVVLFLHCVRLFVTDGLQHARLPCPLSPRVCSNSCPLSWWCHPFLCPSGNSHASFKTLLRCHFLKALMFLTHIYRQVDSLCSGSASVIAVTVLLGSCFSPKNYDLQDRGFLLVYIFKACI